MTNTFEDARTCHLIIFKADISKTEAILATPMAIQIESSEKTILDIKKLFTSKTHTREYYAKLAVALNYQEPRL